MTKRQFVLNCSSVVVPSSAARGGALAIAALVLTACTLLTSYEGLEGATTNCYRSKAPAPPTAVSDGPPVGPLVTAMSSLVLVGGPNVPPPAGLDLDDQCTCPGPASCANSFESPTCDDAGGVDNASGALLAIVANNGLPLADKLLQEGLVSGLFGVLFRITGYSGATDDPAVVVEMLNAVAANEGSGDLPRFDGADRWTLDSASFVKGRTVALALDAYVTRRVLVAHFSRLVPKLRIRPSVSTTLLIDLQLDDVTLVGEIAAVGASGATLKNAQLAGRSSISSWLAQVQRAGACASTDPFAGFQKRLCDLRDLAARAALDNKNAPCNAISVAIGFESVAASTAMDRAPIESPSACDGELDAGIGCP